MLRVVVPLLFLVLAALPAPAAAGVPTSVVVSAPSLVVNAGQTLAMSAVLYDEHGAAIDGAAFTWSTTRGSIGADGVFVPHGPGTATITATADGVSGQLDVVVSIVLGVQIDVEATPGLLILEDVRGSVAVRTADGALRPGARVIVNVEIATLGPLDAMAPEQVTGFTGADGRFSFDPTLLSEIPGIQYRLRVLVDWERNHGSTTREYAIELPAPLPPTVPSP